MFILVYIFFFTLAFYLLVLLFIIYVLFATVLDVVYLLQFHVSNLALIKKRKEMRSWGRIDDDTV